MAIWVLPMDSPGMDPQPFLVTENKTHSPAFSPNGRFLAYVSNESGQEEVFVTEFTLDGAETRAKQRVSRAGGWEPVWSRDGKELVIVYRSGLTKGTGVLSGARRIDVTMSITRIPL